MKLNIGDLLVYYDDDKEGNEVAIDVGLVIKSINGKFDRIIIKWNSVFRAPVFFKDDIEYLIDNGYIKIFPRTNKNEV